MVLVVARTVPPAVLAVGGLVLVPPVVLAVVGARDFSGALVAVSLVAGAGAAYAIDDPAAVTLEPSPTTLAARRLLRAILIAVLLLAAWLGALLIAATFGDRPASLGDRATELVATAALSAAIASRAKTDAPVTSGHGAAAGAFLAMLVIGSLSQRWAVLPMIGGGLHHDRWWSVTGAGLCAAAWSSRDRAARSLHRRHRARRHLYR